MGDPGFEYVTLLPFLVQSMLNSVTTAHGECPPLSEAWLLAAAAVTSRLFSSSLPR
jgi:hypothetical protein